MGPASSQNFGAALSLGVVHKGKMQIIFAIILKERIVPQKCSVQNINGIKSQMGDSSVRVCLMPFSFRETALPACLCLNPSQRTVCTRTALVISPDTIGMLRARLKIKVYFVLVFCHTTGLSVKLHIIIVSSAHGIPCNGDTA